MKVERKQEIEKLTKFYDNPNINVAAVFGRKGIGKSTLLREFAAQKNGICFAAYSTTDQEELKLAAKAFGKENLESVRELCEEVMARAKEEPLLFVIDNYPDFVKADPGFEEALIEYVTGEWRNYQIKLILCGDSYLNMEKYIYGKKSHWKEVQVERITISPMSFREASDFISPEYPEEKLLLYGITGGIPFHLDKIEGLSLEEAIKETFLESRRGGHLLPEEIMGIELREFAYYNRMLSTLAKGLQRVNQISLEVGKPKDVVVPYMNTLMSIGMVTKDTVITEKTNRKKTRYSIVNTSDLFWFKYIAPYMDLYFKGDVNSLITVILSSMGDYLQEVFIRLCKEYLETLSKENKLPFTIDEIGNWWVNDEEKGTSEGFDLVALGKHEDKPATIYGRCYYNDKPIEISELKALIDLTKRVEREGDTYYIIFSSEGFNENAQTVAATIKNIMLVTLDDVVKM